MAKRLKPLIEELGVMVVGWIPECEEMKLESRHLGLVLPGELEHWQEQLQKIAGRLNETLDLNLLLQMAETSEDLKEASDDGLVCNGKLKEPASIAVARDEAFCFYYQENIRLLEKLGAEILYFSPLRDETLPKNTSGDTAWRRISGIVCPRFIRKYVYAAIDTVSGKERHAYFGGVWRIFVSS